jgi:hypothetical protein
LLSVLGEDWRATASPPHLAVKGVVDFDGCCRHCDNCLMALAHQEAVSASNQPGASLSSKHLQLRSQPVGRDIPPSHVSAFCLAVHETGEKNGLAFLVQFCRGSKAEKVTQRISRGRVTNLANSIAYGSLKEESINYLTALGRFFIQQGVLQQVYIDEFKIVHLGENGKRVMKEMNMSVDATHDAARILAGYKWPWIGGADICLPPDLRQEVLNKRSRFSTQLNKKKNNFSDIATYTSSTAATTLSATSKHFVRTSKFPSRTPLEQQLLDSLLSLRAFLAKTRGVPTYSVFSLLELEAFASVRPTSLENLASVPGVTNAKASIAGGGQDVVELITKFCQEKGIDTNVVQKAPHTNGLSGADQIKLADVMDNTVPYSSFLSLFQQRIAVSAYVHYQTLVVSTPCSWHSFTNNHITPVYVYRAPTAVIEVYDKNGKSLKRYKAWEELQMIPASASAPSCVFPSSCSSKLACEADVLHAKFEHTLAPLEHVADAMNVQVTTLLGYCSEMMENGAAYPWSRFNIPDVVVDAVQRAAEKSMRVDGAGVVANANNVDLWKGVSQLRHIKPLLPPEFDVSLIRLVLAHLKRVYGTAGPAVQHARATTAQTCNATHSRKINVLDAEHKSLYKNITSMDSCFADTAKKEVKNASASTNKFEKYKRKPTISAPITTARSERCQESPRRATHVHSLKRNAAAAEIVAVDDTSHAHATHAEKRSCRDVPTVFTDDSTNDATPASNIGMMPFTTASVLTLLESAHENHVKLEDVCFKLVPENVPNPWLWLPKVMGLLDGLCAEGTIYKHGNEFRLM